MPRVLSPSLVACSASYRHECRRRVPRQSEPSPTIARPSPRQGPRDHATSYGYGTLVACDASCWRKGGFAALLALTFACGEARPGPTVGTPCESCADAAAGSGNSGGSASGAAGSVSDAGLAGAGGADAGDAGTFPSAECGNGVQEGEEECDGSDFGGLSCASFGYSEGVLGCNACSADVRACSGTEVCSDGADNDGDGSADCADADCAAACEDFCSAPTPLLEAQTAVGQIAGQNAIASSSCGPSGDSARVVFAYTPAYTGVAEAFLSGATAPLALSAHDSCGPSASELDCSNGVGGSSERFLTLAVTQGVPLYLVVESAGSDLPSSFQLVAASREVACGDGYADLAEECDDGNFSDSDGCSNSCVFQPDEVEPNDSPQEANAFVPPDFFGAIDGADDDDLVSISISAGQRLSAETLDLGDGACARLELDSWVDVLDSFGTVIASNDDGGTGFCAALVTEPLNAGTHYVRLRASGAATSFQYRLRLTTGS